MTEKEAKHQAGKARPEQGEGSSQDTPPKSSRGLRQAGAQASASLPFVPSRPSSALLFERQLLLKAMALLKMILDMNKQESEIKKDGY